MNKLCTLIVLRIKLLLCLQKLLIINKVLIKCKLVITLKVNNIIILQWEAPLLTKNEGECSLHI
jgi:hypothetical protein